MNKEHLFFDLDGTIIDSAPGIFKSISYALDKMGVEDISLEEKNSFVGPPLVDSFERLGFTRTEAETAVKFYREYYSAGGLYLVDPYEGIIDSLDKLAQDNSIYIATSKPEQFAKMILEKLQINHYFNGIYGASMDSSRASKDKVLAYAVANANVRSLSQAVMIGDREHDILGAHHVGLESIGVLYGYGSMAELQEAGATMIVEQPVDLLDVLG